MQDPLRPVFCLLVEDSPLVGLDLADALDIHGYYVAGPFPCGREASDWLARFTPDVAVVDLTLRDGWCQDVIRELQARAIPFLIYSGCPSHRRPSHVPSDVPWLEKPASRGLISAVLQELLSNGVPEAAHVSKRVHQMEQSHRKQKQTGSEIAQEVAHEA